MPLFSKNLELGPPLKISSWRKIAIGTWKSAGDPSVYGTLDMDVGEALSYLERLRQKTGKKLTFTHFIGKAVAQTLEKHPQINCILRFGKLYPRKSIDIFFQVANDVEGKDLSGFTIRETNRKSIPEISDEMQARVQAGRAKGDPELIKMKNIMGSVPAILLHFVVNLTGFILYNLNIWSPLFGSPRDPFGSAMITSVGPLGLDSGHGALVPYSRVPLLIAVCAVKDTPVVKEGRIQIAQICKLCVTFDHRLIDGIHASHMVKSLKKILEQPETELGL
jgi:pyruvate/2-oxoglutarate dehydrogenase complex dihydrolipoamide acyltransferase (E2) component